jgi:hypothetical protein
MLWDHAMTPMIMTPDEARAILTRLGWSQTLLWQMAQRDDSFTRKQLRGREPIDAALASWLRGLDRLHGTPAVSQWLSLIDNPPGRVTRQVA